MARKSPIEVYTTKFVRSHGKEPKGFGAWGFIVMDDTCNKECALFEVPAMTYSDAKVWAKAHVRAQYPDEVATGYLSLEVAP